MAGRNQEPGEPRRKHPFAAGVLTMAVIASGGFLLENNFNNGDLTDAFQHLVGQPYRDANVGFQPAGGAAKQTAQAAPSATESAASPEPTATDSPSPEPTATQTPAAPAADAPVIVIDPGHSAKDIDSDTGKIPAAKVEVGGESYAIRDHDYPNQPEIDETFAVSACAGEALTADGYKVILTKKSTKDSVSLANRAKIANDANAALAISIHDDHSAQYGYGTVNDQRGVAVGGKYPKQYREGTGPDGTTVKVIFSDKAVAEESQKAAQEMAKARTTAQGINVKITQTSLAGRTGLAGGNIWLVQDLSRGPWIYNEMAAKQNGSEKKKLSQSDLVKYATGIVMGAEAYVKLASADGPDQAAMATCITKHY